MTTTPEEQQGGSGSGVMAVKGKRSTGAKFATVAAYEQPHSQIRVNALIEFDVSALGRFKADQIAAILEGMGRVAAVNGVSPPLSQNALKVKEEKDG